MHKRVLREASIVVPPETFAPTTLESWLHAQESAGILCSLCGMQINLLSHTPDPANTGQFMCGLAIPLEIIP